MKKYQIQNSIGSGNFSTVFKGVLLPERAPCAIKILQSHQKIAIRQAQLLDKFKHPNIISIIDFYQRENESHLILQYLGINTLQFYQSHPNGLKQIQVKCILFQTALGLSFVHSFRIIHRDVKPQNILIDKKKAIVKLIDFGLAISQTQSTTDYIATRWYRAPQNLLGTKQYTCAIDVFSLACVIVQLKTGNPLFPGANNLEQIFKIFNILGYPTATSWPKGFQKIQQLGIITYGLQKNAGTGIRNLMKGCDLKLILLLQSMLQLNPKNRITCVQLLKNDYFKDIKNIVPQFIYKRYEQDILSLKTITFKGFQPAKCSKNTSNQIHPKSPKINFHHVSGKAKNNQSNNQTQQLNGSYQFKTIQSPKNAPSSPRLLREQKSTSLDSYQPNVQALSQINQKIEQKQQIQKNQKEAQILQDVNSIRKLSTPVSIENLKLNAKVNIKLQNTQYLQKINSPTQFFNFKEQTHRFPLQNHAKFSFQQNKIQKISVQSQQQKQMVSPVNNIKESNHFSSQNSNNVLHNIQLANKNVDNNNYHMTQSKIKIQSINPNPSQVQSQHSSQLQNQKQNGNGMVYPIIPNVQMVAQPRISNKTNFSNVPIKMSPNSSKFMKNTQNEQLNSSISYHPQLPNHQLNLHFSSKPYIKYELNQRSNITNTYRNAQNYSTINDSINEEKLRKKKIISNNGIKSPTANSNFFPWNQNMSKIEQLPNKTQMFFRSPNKQFFNNNFLPSPSNRYSLYGGTTTPNSPQNNISIGRNKRINGMSGPIPQFYSPPNRKF